jgi:hypothetical protein
VFHDAEDYEARAGECERLACGTRDPVLREDLLSLGRIYQDYAGHLRGRSNENEPGWRQAANG